MGIRLFFFITLCFPFLGIPADETCSIDKHGAISLGGKRFQMVFFNAKWHSFPQYTPIPGLYRIEKRNFVGDSHEIDIIASNKEYIVFVEVKTRTLGKENPNEPRPASSVTPEKQRAIISASKIYSAFNPTNKKKRFDIIEVYINQNSKRKRVAEIKHLQSAFNANTAFTYRKDY